MKVLLFVISTELELSFSHKANLALIDDMGFELVGIVTALREEAGSVFMDVPVYYIDDINKKTADIFIFPKKHLYIPPEHKEFYDSLEKNCRFPKNRLKYDDWLLKLFMTAKYKNSPDKEIQDIVKYWENHEFSVYDQYMDDVPDTYDEVFFDDNLNLPYIFFETVAGKRLKMYYPQNYNFEMKDGKPYVKNILHEQTPRSPHLYTAENHKVEDGDIIIDAGVCEGNFSLRYVDIASKFYLFENDPIWIEPLQCTFSQANIDANLTAKGVGNVTNENTVRIEDVVKDTGGINYFLKMDVEGFEQQGLKGADKILRRY